MPETNPIDLLQSRSSKVQNDDNFQQPAEPTSTLVTLTLDQIDTYDQNPRRAKNVEYESIKESIRTDGLNSPPDVTQRTASDRYFIANGGNTRLTILKELVKEFREKNDHAKADEFNTITCRLVPWVSDIHILAAHITENDKRGGMVFIDKAIAMRDLLRMAFKNKSISGSWQTLKYKEVSSILSESGWTITTDEISRYRSILSYEDDLKSYLYRHNEINNETGDAYPPVKKWQTRWIHSTLTRYSKFLKERVDSEDKTLDNDVNQEKLETYWKSLLAQADCPAIDTEAHQRKLAASMNEYVSETFSIGVIEIEAAFVTHAEPANADTAPPPVQATLTDNAGATQSSNDEVNGPITSGASSGESVPIDQLEMQCRSAVKRLAGLFEIATLPTDDGIRVMLQPPKQPIDLDGEISKAAAFWTLYLGTWSSLSTERMTTYFKTKPKHCFNLRDAFAGEENEVRIRVTQYLLRMRQAKALKPQDKKVAQLLNSFEHSMSRYLAATAAAQDI